VSHRSEIATLKMKHDIVSAIVRGLQPNATAEARKAGLLAFNAFRDEVKRRR
jgi:hypothetical protein